MADETKREGGDSLPSSFITNAPNAHILHQVDLNCALGHQDLPESPARSGTWLIAADGPSLDPEEVRRYKADGAHVCAIKGAHDFLMDAGVTVGSFVACDARPTTTVKPHLFVNYYLASTCSPELFKKFIWRDESFDPYKVFIWHPTLPEGIGPIVIKHYPKAVLLGGGSTAALRAITVGYRLGYRKIVLMGCDSSYADGVTHASGKIAPDETITVKIGDREFLTNTPMSRQALDFIEIKKRFENQEYGNEPVEITAVGDGLLPYLTQKEKKC